MKGRVGDGFRRAYTGGVEGRVAALGYGLSWGVKSGARESLSCALPAVTHSVPGVAVVHAADVPTGTAAAAAGAATSATAAAPAARSVAAEPVVILMVSSSSVVWVRNRTTSRITLRRREVVPADSHLLPLP